MNSSNLPTIAQPENYAKAIPINSFTLALIFTLIYIPLLGLFMLKAVKNPTYVLWITAFFCQGRLTLRISTGSGD